MPDSKLNLDLIHMVQRARMIHDASAKPSEVVGVYRIEAKPANLTQVPTVQAGYWLVPTTIEEMDSLWERIKQATKAGHLGYKSKIPTIPSPGQTNSQTRIILVCTYNADDTADVERVHRVLRELGITTELHYQRQ